VSLWPLRKDQTLSGEKKRETWPSWGTNVQNRKKSLSQRKSENWEKISSRGGFITGKEGGGLRRLPKGRATSPKWQIEVQVEDCLWSVTKGLLQESCLNRLVRTARHHPLGGQTIQRSREQRNPGRTIAYDWVEEQNTLIRK